MGENVKNKKHINFEVGGRYRNRFGWYEVLRLLNDEMLVRYESDGREQILDFESQHRIMSNIETEEETVTPYGDHERNITYFRTLGYISNKNNSFIEAIIPPNSKDGFDNTYCKVKGRYPNTEQMGYYVHHDENVDKWGVEMRLTFKVPSSISLDDLDFGHGIDIVRSPNKDERRVNCNALCWNLLGIGFDLGPEHNLGTIKDSIPEKYKEDYDSSISIF